MAENSEDIKIIEKEYAETLIETSAKLAKLRDNQAFVYQTLSQALNNKLNGDSMKVLSEVYKV